MGRIDSLHDSSPILNGGNAQAKALVQFGTVVTEVQGSHEQKQGSRSIC
jgi:hypothetical protein